MSVVDLLKTGVSAVIGSIGTAARDIRAAITGKEVETEEGRMKVLQLAHDIELAALDADKQLNVAQVEVNKTEASDPSLFKSGWRPAVGWVCVCGLAYQFVILPLFPWFANCAGHVLYAIFPHAEILSKHVPAMPSLDMGTLTTLLMGMLGLGGMRTFEKLKGVD